MEFVTTREELRTIYKTPRPTDGSIRKELKALDGHSRSFIGKSPFVLIGSSDGAGNADVTPKGDKPGFAAVLDEKTIGQHHPQRADDHFKINSSKNFATKVM